MRVGVTSNTTFLGIVSIKVSVKGVEEASCSFPTYKAVPGSCGMELEIPLEQIIQQDQDSNLQAIQIRQYIGISQQTIYWLNILSWNIQWYSHENIRFFRTFIQSWLRKHNTLKDRMFNSLNINVIGKKGKVTPHDSDTIQNSFHQIGRARNQEHSCGKNLFKSFQPPLVNMHLSWQQVTLFNCLKFYVQKFKMIYISKINPSQLGFADAPSLLIKLSLNLKQSPRLKQRQGLSFYGLIQCMQHGQQANIREDPQYSFSENEIYSLQ